MKHFTNQHIQIIEAHFLLDTKVKIDLRATQIGGSWQGKDSSTGKPRPWDTETLHFFYEQTRTVKNPCILDIGANTGTYCLLPVLNRTITGYAFEPNPEVYRILKNNLALNGVQNNIQTIPMALADRKGFVQLKIPATGTDSGLSCLGNPQRFERWTEISVPTDTLDNIAQWKKISHVDFIKIDTEGCELYVLRGGEQLIRSSLPYILLEFEEQNTSQFGYHPDEIIELLTSWGYEFKKISSSDVYFYKRNDTCHHLISGDSTIKIGAESSSNLFVEYSETEKSKTLDNILSMKSKNISMQAIYSHWIHLLRTIENRLYYRDQSAESLELLALLAQKHAPTVIVELGTLFGMSTRAWILAVPDAQIHAVDLSFNAFWRAQEYFPLDTSRITFHEQNILSMDFKSLWSAEDRVLFFVDAHDMPDAPIMRHICKNALPYLPKGSIVVIDDIWFSPQRLVRDNAQDYFNRIILSYIDELQCFTGYFAPYHKGGSFIGFQEIIPLMQFVNSKRIELEFIPGGKQVWFTLDCEKLLTQNHSAIIFQENETGVVEYNPLDIPCTQPLAKKIMPKAARIYHQGQITEAAKLLVDVANKEPSSEACHALAVCQARGGQLDNAHKLAQLALKAGGSPGIHRLAHDLEARVGKPKVRMTGHNELTIFAVPKPFIGHEAIIQKNALRSWARLEPKPEIILMGNEFGVKEMALEIGARHIPELNVNEYGTPLLDDIFKKAWDASTNDILAYVNADIILMNDFHAAATTATKQFSEFLIIGQRWDLAVWELLDFSESWIERIKKEVQINGFLYSPTGLDYFVHVRGQWRGLPPFALGRTAWDNWLVKKAVEDDIPIIDGTGYITAIHQDHGYTHRPGGKKEIWQGIEAKRNRAMAGALEANSFSTCAKLTFNEQGQIKERETASNLSSEELYQIKHKQWCLRQNQRMKEIGQDELALFYLDKAS